MIFLSLFVWTRSLCVDINENGIRKYLEFRISSCPCTHKDVATNRGAHMSETGSIVSLTGQLFIKKILFWFNICSAFCRHPTVCRTGTFFTQSVKLLVKLEIVVPMWYKFVVSTGTFLRRKKALNICILVSWFVIASFFYCLNITGDLKLN